MSNLLCRLLGLADVVHVTTMSKASVYRNIQAGEFPKPIRISARRVAWRETDIVAWLEQRGGAAA